MQSKFFLAIISLIAIDQASKATYLYLKKQTFINDSGVFSAPFKQEIIILCSIVMLLGLIVFLFQTVGFKKDTEDSKQLNKEHNRVVYLSIILIICGGTSNLIDRLVYGGVIDNMAIRTLTFNSSDIIILVGVLGLAFLP